MATDPAVPVEAAVDRLEATAQVDRDLDGGITVDDLGGSGEAFAGLVGHDRFLPLIGVGAEGRVAALGWSSAERGTPSSVAAPSRACQTNAVR